MRNVFRLVMLVGGGLLCGITHGAAPDEPSFVVINIDDLGYADIEPFGSTLNRTPNLTRMAQEGRKLTCFYAAPVCSPSRSSLMTGCYPKRVLPISGVLFPAAAAGLHPDERTVAELLRDVGYTTACIGKWHLGDQPAFLPTRQGFDYYLGIPYSNDMGTAAEGSKSNLGDKLPVSNAAASPAANSLASGTNETGVTGNLQPPLPLLANETVIARVGPAEQQDIVRRYTAAAVKFLRDHRDQRFFLYLPHTAVHFPLYPSESFRGKSAHGLYSDWVEEMDWSVGQVFEAIRELKLDQRTLVIFTSDNGGTPRAVNTPLRGFKASTWEGGMRVPTIAWWPGRIPAGTATDAVTGMMDILPTLVKLGGGKLPTDRKIDGGDIWPLLAGTPDAKSPHEAFYYFRGLNLEAVRSGPWKLHFGTPAVATAKAKSKAKTNGKKSAAGLQLFHLDSDVGESTNVADGHPDVVQRLQALATAMHEDLGRNGVGPGCRPLGRDPHPQPLIAHDGTIREGFRPK